MQNKLQIIFLERIGQLLYPNERETEEQICFPLRWHPVNQCKPHTYIKEEMVKLLNSDVSNINQVISRGVAQKIWITFQEEMIADGFSVKRNGKKGQPKDNSQSAYRVTYQWLWEKKFPRMAWDLAKEVAFPVKDELEMIPYEIPIHQDNRIISRNIPTEETLQKEKEYRLKLNLPHTGYLLLINETADGDRFLIVPSTAFADIPCCRLSQPLYLPPDNDKHRAPLAFETEKELLLAIVTEQEINLSWINEDYRNEDVDLNEQRLLEIFQEVGNLSNCHVLKRSFRFV